VPPQPRVAQRGLRDIVLAAYRIFAETFTPLLEEVSFTPNYA
jgi:hypothetical protein